MAAATATTSSDVTMDERMLFHLFLLTHSVCAFLRILLLLYTFQVPIACTALRCYLIFAFNESSLTNGLTCDFSWLSGVPVAESRCLVHIAQSIHSVGFIFNFFFSLSSWSLSLSLTKLSRSSCNVFYCLESHVVPHHPLTDWKSVRKDKSKLAEIKWMCVWHFRYDFHCGWLTLTVCCVWLSGVVWSDKSQLFIRPNETCQKLHEEKSGGWIVRQHSHCQFSSTRNQISFFDSTHFLIAVD